MATEKTQVIQDSNQQELMNKVSEIREFLDKYVIYPCFNFKHHLCLEIPLSDIDFTAAGKEGFVIWLKKKGGIAFDYAKMQLMISTDNTNWRGIDVRDCDIQVSEKGAFVDIKLYDVKL